MKIVLKLSVLLAAAVILALLVAIVPASAEEPTDTSTPPVGYVPIPAAEHFPLGDGATALLIQDFLPWGLNSNEQALAELGVSYDLANSASLAGLDLSGYKFIMYASDQPTSYYLNLQANLGKITDYVEDGGLLIAHVCDWAWNNGDWRGLSILPGNVTHKTAWDNIDYTSQLIHITNPAHAVAAGLDDAYLSNWNFSTHGILTDLLGGTDTVMVSNDGLLDGPTYVDYQYGWGRVLATMQTVEWGYGQWPDRPELLRNEIRFAQRWQGRPVGGIIVPTETDDSGLAMPWIIGAALVVVAGLSLAVWSKKRGAQRASDR